jgi:hypothetical protein
LFYTKYLQSRNNGFFLFLDRRSFPLSFAPTQSTFFHAGFPDYSGDFDYRGGFPPEGLQRTPGPKAILYYLPRDADLRERGYRLPQSTSTIWKMAGAQMLKRLPIKNVVREEMPLERFIALMLEQARSEERLRLARSALWCC